MSIRYNSGLYEVTHEDGKTYKVYASKNKAHFLFNGASSLGIVKVKLVETKHRMDFPSYGRIL